MNLQEYNKARDDWREEYGWILEACPSLRYCHSYNRMGEVVSLYDERPPDVWWKVLGYEWGTCDDIYCYTDWLSPRFKRCSRLRLNMMSKEDRAVYHTLPDTLTIHRGCYAENAYGMSWTLDKDLATKFPALNRYYRHGEQPLVLTRTIPKRECVYHNSRDEQEIITWVPS